MRDFRYNRYLTYTERPEIKKTAKINGDTDTSKITGNLESCLVPVGTIPIVASGFIGFKIGDVAVVLSSLVLFPNVNSSKKAVCNLLYTSIPFQRMMLLVELFSCRKRVCLVFKTAANHRLTFIPPQKAI
jgi:hypothetical protein